MSAFINTHTGVVVDVADAKDGRFVAPLWQPYDGTDGAGVDGYEAMRVPELKAEIERRNEGRDEAARVPAEGRKPDLIAALKADDDAHAGL